MQYSYWTEATCGGLRNQNLSTESGRSDVMKAAFFQKGRWDNIGKKVWILPFHIFYLSKFWRTVRSWPHDNCWVRKWTQSVRRYCKSLRQVIRTDIGGFTQTGTVPGRYSVDRTDSGWLSSRTKSLAQKGLPTEIFHCQARDVWDFQCRYVGTDAFTNATYRKSKKKGRSAVKAFMMLTWSIVIQLPCLNL